MAKGVSPLVGYNTNVRHKTKLYHIQTEDSGIQHPHIITHLFADGGRIIASKKTSYAEHIGREDLHRIVKQLMQEQHKAMFIALRDCVYDEDVEPAAAAAGHAPLGTADPAHPPPAASAGPSLDVEALERAAEARAAQSALSDGIPEPRKRRGSGRYQATVPARTSPESTARAPASIFGQHLMTEKSLDEVILSYLADDVDEAGG